MHTVYLAGPIAGCNDEKAHGWRTTVMQQADPRFRFRNPMDRDYRNVPNPDYIKLVEDDVLDILASDIVVFNFGFGPSFGTCMEMPYAYFARKVIIAVVGDEYVSPWVKYHATILVPDVLEAVGQLNMLAGF